MTDLNYGCDIVNVFQNITKNCSDDISFAEDQCKLFCIISIGLFEKVEYKLIKNNGKDNKNNNKKLDIIELGIRKNIINIAYKSGFV